MYFNLLYVCLLPFHFQLFDKIIIVGAVETDEDHLKYETQCGKLPSPVSSRITNAKKAEKHYPWVVLVTRNNEHIEKNKYKGLLCGGSIITPNSVITAAHCICGYKPWDYKDIFMVPKAILKKTQCQGGLGKVKDKDNLENEITEVNKITVHAGSKSKKQANLEFIILYAIVHDEYDNPRQMTPWVGQYDLGLLRTFHTKDNGIRFYPRNNLRTDFLVGPICLAAENVKLIGMEIEMVGWGWLYHESETTNSGEEGPEENQHTCTTNAFGPIHERLQYCDVNYLKIHEWKCDMVKKTNHAKGFEMYLEHTLKLKEPEKKNVIKRILKPGATKQYPPGYDYEKCKAWWNKAESLVNEKTQTSNIDKLREIWKDTLQIEIGELIKKKGSNKKDKFAPLERCYKDTLFEDYGWCFTLGGIPSEQWGFCDISCKTMSNYHNRHDTAPDIYRKMSWIVDSKDPQKCINHLKEVDKIGSICVKPLLPTILIPQFTLDEKENLHYYINYQEEPKDYANHKEFGYQEMCSGDSGSGNWIYDSENQRASLVGITSHSLNWDGPHECSGPSVVTSTTLPQFNNWIKKHAMINFVNFV